MENNFISVKNDRFYADGKPFRFIGANMYELANVDSSTAEAMLKEASDQGFSVIRFWAFEPLEKTNLNNICDIAKMLDLKIIPVLADPSGYLQSYKIENAWYSDGYKNNYLKYACDITGGFKDRYEILLWELINEPVTGSFEDIYNFAKDASEKLKEADPNHLISIGTIGGIGDKFGDFFSRFNISGFEKLYAIKTLDAVSIHDYSFNSTVLERLDIMYRLQGKYKNSNLSSSFANIINYIPFAIDKITLNNFKKTFDFPLTIRSLWKRYNEKNISIAKKLNKPLYVGEVGFKKELGDLRKIVLEKEFKRYFDEGVSGVLLWSFEARGKSKDGHDYGFDTNDGFGEIIKRFDL